MARVGDLKESATSKSSRTVTSRGLTHQRFVAVGFV